MVRTNVFLRLLNYRVNLADEIESDIQRLVSRSCAVGTIDRRISSSSAVINGSSSRKQRQLITSKNREYNEDDKQSKHSASPPTTLDERIDEAAKDSNIKYINRDSDKFNETSPNVSLSTRESSTKFRTLLQQHRKVIKELHETDEFLPFLDRKVII